MNGSLENPTPEINVRECPSCGAEGRYLGRVLIGGRGVWACPVCGTKWQDANEKPTTKGVPIRRAEPGEPDA